MEYPDRVRSSLEKASRFMEEHRNSDGLWSDFLTLAGESVYWVSGYVGYALSRYGDVHDWLVEVGSSILERQDEDGGWGYGPGVPTDADSTSWCLRFLSSLGIQSLEGREKASLFILRHQNRHDGGFRTYFSPRDVGRYMRLDGNISFEGWLSSQPCVTAVTIEALIESGFSNRIHRALDFIRRSQTAEGCWNSYWWSGKLYATTHCMEALKYGGMRKDAKTLVRAQDWIAGMQLDDGSWRDSVENEGVPFYTALALTGLMVEPRPGLSERIRQGIDWLLSHQLADGSWASSYILRIPHPSVKEPWKESFWKPGGRAINAVIKDHRRLFSTATVFTALSEFMESLPEEEIKW